MRSLPAAVEPTREESAHDDLRLLRHLRYDYARKVRVVRSNLHPLLSPVGNDQTELTNFIHALLQRGECNDLIVNLVRSLDLEDLSLLQLLVSNSDFVFAWPTSPNLALVSRTMLTGKSKRVL